MKFKGKIAIWFYAVFLLSALFTLSTAVKAFMDGNMTAMFLDLTVFIVLALLCVPILLNNYVELKNDLLFIRFGFIRLEIPYQEIVSLTKTNNPLSSLAASFDRIEIKRSKKGSVMIAIEDKEQFLSEMQKLSPNIAIRSA